MNAAAIRHSTHDPGVDNDDACMRASCTDPPPAFEHCAASRSEHCSIADDETDAVSDGFVKTMLTTSNGSVLRFKPNDYVVPRHFTRDDLTHGYIRDVTQERGYVIYWPETGKTGSGWTDDDLL